jgi:acyl-CoA thioesterase FadM
MGFERSWKIYVGDTDCFGRVYTPVVVDYAIRTLQDFRADLGLDVDFYLENDVIAPAKNVDIDYEGPIEPDDTLTIALDPTVGKTSITYAVDGTVAEERVARGSMTMVYVTRSGGEPVRVPEEVRRRFEA